MSDSNKSTKFRVTSLTAAGLLLLWYFYGVDLSKHPWFEWANLGGQTLLPLLFLVIMVFCLIESIAEYKSYENKSIISGPLMLFAILAVVSTILIIYPKLVSGSFLSETNRSDIIIPIALSLPTALGACNLRISIELFIVFYKFRKTILPSQISELAISSIFALSGIMLICYITRDYAYVVMATRYTVFTISFIAIYLLLIPNKKLHSKEELELLSIKNKSLNRQVELSDYGLSQNLKDFPDKKKFHKNVMKEIVRDHEEEQKKIIPQFETLAPLSFMQSGEHYKLEKMEEDEKVIKISFFNKEKKVVEDSVDIKFKYIQSALQSLKIPKEGNDPRGFLTPLTLKAYELQFFNECDKNKLLCEFSNHIPLSDLKDLIKKRDPDINCISDGGWTPLLIAAANGREDILAYLLQKAADPNIVNDLGRSPLLFAAWYGNESMCKRLIQYGAKVDQQDHDGMTPLMKATYRGHGSVVKLLLENGADPRIEDESNKTASDFAISGKYGDIALLLSRACTEDRVTS